MEMNSEEKKYHHGDLHEGLIAAGSELLKEKGVAGLSLREVAKRVGVSHTAPYRHFKDKEALLKAIAQKAYDELGELIKQDIERISNDPKKQMIQATVSYISYAIRNPEFTNLMFGGMVKADGAFHFSDSENSCFKILTEIITHGQNENEFKAGDAKVYAMGVWSSIHGLSMLVTSGQIAVSATELISIQKLTAHIINTQIEGIAIADK